MITPPGYMKTTVVYFHDGEYHIALAKIITGPAAYLKEPAPLQYKMRKREFRQIKLPFYSLFSFLHNKE